MATAAAAPKLRSLSMLSPTWDVTGKIILLGDNCVGKTCLLLRFNDDSFMSGSYRTTVGMDFKTKVVEVNGKRVKLQVWDTAGQEKFRSLVSSYYRDVDAVFLVYDITNRKTYENVRHWMSNIREMATKDCLVFLLGNKVDLEAERQVSYEDGDTIAGELNAIFLETSAKTGINVKTAFHAVAVELANLEAANGVDSVDHGDAQPGGQDEKPVKRFIDAHANNTKPGRLASAYYSARNSANCAGGCGT